jgi:hypothetical protein
MGCKSIGICDSWLRWISSMRFKELAKSGCHHQ